MTPEASDQPDLSVIIPAYRAADYVNEALDSVLAQVSAQTEIIVVNDGSPDTDRLEQVLAPYRKRIVYIKKENGGVSSARNAGILAARADWLAFLDSDDIWLPTYLKDQQACLREHPEADMVFPDAQFFGNTTLVGRSSAEFSPVEGEITFLRALAGEITIAYAGLIRRDMVIRAGLFDTSLRGSEDFNLWLRMMRSGARLVHNPKPLYGYRRHDKSLTFNPAWMAERILESLRRTEETIPLSSEEQAALAKHRRKMTLELALMRGKAALAERDWAHAIEHFEQANALQPSAKLTALLVSLKVCPWLLYRIYNVRERRSSS